jgi:hypothetical protein
MSSTSNTINTNSPARNSMKPPTIHQEEAERGDSRSLLDNPSMGPSDLTAREVSTRDIKSQRVETLLREISGSNDRVESELVRLKSTCVEMLSALVVNQSIHSMSGWHCCVWSDAVMLFYMGNYSKR